VAKLHLTLFAKIAISLIFLFTLAMLTSGYFIVLNQNNNILKEKEKLAFASAKSLAEGSIDALVSRDFEFLESWLKAVVITDIYAYGYISGVSGHILVHTDVDQIAKYTQLPSFNHYTSRNLIYHGRPVKEIIYASSIDDDVFANAHIAYYTDNSLFTVFSNNDIYILFLVTVTFLSLILLATLYIIRLHTSPLTELNSSIQSFTFDNNSAIAPEILDRPDEIGNLANSFMELMSRLNLAYQELKNEEQLLQGKVEQRTQDLQNQNKVLIKMQAQLVESEKMASLGNLVAGIAHEINTPIGICLTAVSHLNDASHDLQLKYDQKKLSESDFKNFLSLSHDSCEIATENIKRAAQLISNFKKIAVGQHTDTKSCFKLYTELQRLVKILLPKNNSNAITVQLEGDKSIAINSYQSAFYQLFSNLINNSLLHGFENKKSGLIKIAFEMDDEQLSLMYSDNGHGIPQEILEHLFEPFVTTKRGQGGSGLGTHIVYNLVVQKLGGTIACDSKLGHGVQFTITFPVESCQL